MIPLGMGEDSLCSNQDSIWKETALCRNREIRVERRWEGARPPGARRQSCKGVFRILRNSKSTWRRKLAKGETWALKRLELSDNFLVSDGRVFFFFNLFVPIPKTPSDQEPQRSREMSEYG